MAPAQQNINVWAGNTLRIGFAFKNADNSPFDLTGSKLVFRAVATTATIRKDSDDSGSGLEITDELGGEAELFLTVAETRSLATGAAGNVAKVKFELERWISVDQTSLIYGELLVTIWVNDDVDP